MFASCKLCKKQSVIEFMVQSFLRKHKLTKKTLECYLHWDNGRKTTRMIAKEVEINHSTVARHLQKLKFVCPELLVKKLQIPPLYKMLHLPEEDNPQSRTFFEYYGQIKQKF